MKQNAKKNVPFVKQNVTKLEVFILGRQTIDQRRKKGWGGWVGKGEESGLRKDRDREKGDKVKNLKRSIDT